MKVVVFGSGSFGTAMAAAVARNGHHVVILTRRDEVMKGINHKRHNPLHLKEFKLSTRITADTDAFRALLDAEVIINAIPMQFTEKFLRGVRKYIGKNILVVNTSKGLCEETLELAYEIFAKVLGAEHPCAFFGGPTFAKELIIGMPSGGVMASINLATAERAAAVFSPRCAYIRAKTSSV